MSDHDLASYGAGNGASGDPDETVDSPAPAPVEMELESMVEETELVAQGARGEGAGQVASALEGTGLELMARRVLAKRGIEISAVQGPGSAESSAAAPVGAPLRDIAEIATPMAAAPRGAAPALPAAASASMLESVIWDGDADGRERVFDTHLYPYSAIAALEITARDGSMYVGTGWFVSPHTVITAGHCVYVHGAQSAVGNGWVKSIRVIPGRNGVGTGKAFEPFESVTSTRFRSVAGWVNNAEPGSDYGAILLPPGSNPNGTRVGLFGIGSFSDAQLGAFNLNVAGYPGDKGGNERQTLWFDVKRTKRVTPRQLFYDVDTYGGQSGAPVFVVRGNERVVVAIHAYGTSASITSNSGTRITPEVFQRINSWKS